MKLEKGERTEWDEGKRERIKGQGDRGERGEDRLLKGRKQKSEAEGRERRTE